MTKVFIFDVYFEKDLHRNRWEVANHLSYQPYETLKTSFFLTLQGYKVLRKSRIVWTTECLKKDKNSHGELSSTSEVPRLQVFWIDLERNHSECSYYSYIIILRKQLFKKGSSSSRYIAQMTSFLYPINKINKYYLWAVVVLKLWKRSPNYTQPLSVFQIIYRQWKLEKFVLVRCFRGLRVMIFLCNNFLYRVLLHNKRLLREVSEAFDFGCSSSFLLNHKQLTLQEIRW